MRYDQSLFELRHRKNIKWRQVEPDQIPLWIAEMDFAIAPQITDGIATFLQEGGAGYPAEETIEAYRVALHDWYQGRFGSELAIDRMAELQSVLHTLEIVVSLRVPEDAAVIVPTPAYMPFLNAEKWLKRRLITVPMVRDAWGKYDYDLGVLDDAFKQGGKLLLLCNPHNPTGSLLTREQAVAIGQVVEQHQGLVFSDEIHVPIMYRDSPEFVSYASAAESHRLHTYTALSASKGWNIPGMKCATLVMPDAEEAKHIRSVNHPGSVAVQASEIAFRDCHQWLEITTDVLRENVAMFADFMKSEYPESRFVQPEASYLAWADFTAYATSTGLNPATELATRGRVVVTDGSDCGSPGFARINLATSKQVLEEAMHRIRTTIA